MTNLHKASISIMDEPNKNQPPKSPDGNGCLSPILFWGGLIGIFFAAKWLESESPGSGKWLFPGIPAAAVIGTILYIIIGRTAKDTAINIYIILKWIVGLLLVSFIISSVTKCGSQSSTSPNDGYYRP